MVEKKMLQIIGGVTVGALVVVAIVVPCVLLIPEDEPATEPTEPPSGDDRPTYTFDDLMGEDYQYSSLYPTWDKTDDTNTQFITQNSAGNIVTRSYTEPDTDVKTLITGTDDPKTSTYAVSADNQFIYYRRNAKQVWRHSYTADFAIYRIDEGAGVRVDNKIMPKFPDDGMIHHLEWSPTGHALAIVYDWDLWVVEDLHAATPTLTRVTDDGEQNKIYNAIPDWVYEEEMIGSNNVLHWSPNSTHIAFLRTDDTNTSIVEFSMYNEAQYPETVRIAYPKAGTSNPTVTLHAYNLADKSLKEMVPPEWPDTSANPNANFDEYYFSRFTWLDENTCMPTWTDRPQTYSVSTACTRDPSTLEWTCTYIDASTESVTNGWVGSFGPFDIVWMDATTHFTIYARANDGDATDGRWQIAKVDWASPSKTWLTKTNFDIVGLYWYDAANDFLYFEAAAPLPKQRNVYRVKGSADSDEAPECMSCQLNEDYVDRCGWITTRFNLDGSVAIMNCRGYREPMTAYYTITGGVWSDATVLYNNQELVDKVAAIKWPQKIYGEFNSTKYREKPLKYEMYVPADFDNSGNTKYPLLIEVYAGPEFQTVTDVWTRGWSSTHMVSDKNVVVASVDGRNSAFEGYKFMRQAYKQLGQHEPEDQTEFAAWLASQPYIDENLVGLWGWGDECRVAINLAKREQNSGQLNLSYGGYTTTHTLGYDAGNTFKCGIAVAPLADWRFYDSMYAERYMGRPEDNDAAYSNASMITAHDLNNFKNVEYTLIHGTADDNVHFQSAAEMEKALVEADVDFDTFFYADQAHSINAGNANKHIYRQLTSRMSHCLGRCDTPYPGGC